MKIFTFNVTILVEHKIVLNFVTEMQGIETIMLIHILNLKLVGLHLNKKK